MCPYLKKNPESLVRAIRLDHSEDCEEIVHSNMYKNMPVNTTSNLVQSKYVCFCGCHQCSVCVKILFSNKAAFDVDQRAKYM